jgi:hypothetical protein
MEVLMQIPRKVSPLFVVAAALGLLIGAQPALGYTELRTTGTVGAHSLTDTRRSLGADCFYLFSDRGTAWYLRDITIDPPNMRAVPGQGEQKVGWSFTIHRKVVALGGTSHWEHRYTSPVMKATTDSSHDASFSPMGVRVRGARRSSADSKYFYRATIKAIWFRANGNVMGTAKMRVEWFKASMGSDSDKQRWSCTGHIY